jgi:hypothetical protein
MKPSVILGLILLCGFAGCTGWSAEKLSLSELKALAERARPEECVHICEDIARRALDEAKTQFANGSIETAKLALRDVSTYAEKASDAAIRTKKREKELEIAIREMSHHLDDLRHTLSFEDQPEVAGVMEHLEKLRTQLLKNMFAKAKKK